MEPRELASSAVDAAREVVAAEVDAMRDEIERPWREGRPGKAAETGRWIGVGLAAAAFVGGVVAALYVERPWE